MVVAVEGCGGLLKVRSPPPSTHGFNWFKNRGDHPNFFCPSHSEVGNIVANILAFQEPVQSSNSHQWHPHHLYLLPFHPPPPIYLFIYFHPFGLERSFGVLGGSQVATAGLFLSIPPIPLFLSLPFFLSPFLSFCLCSN